MHISDWQLASAFGLGLIGLISGGWILRLRQPGEPEPPRQTNAGQDALASQSGNAAQTELLDGPGDADHGGRIAALEAELLLAQAALEQENKAAKALETECEEAREEAELILLQLHQVQEELEHYFLLSRDLQEQLNGRQLASEPVVHLAEVHALKQRFTEILERCHRRDQHWQVVLLRQHRALQRAKLLLQQQRQPARARFASPSAMVSEDIAFI